jgi:hypothetical protein
MHENRRVYGGLYVCRGIERKVNVDVNPALDMVRKQNTG